ncbi:MAG: response regulator [Acidobacteriota bacterium]
MAEPAHPLRTTPRILVVDDDALVRLTVGDILEAAGYESHSVPSGDLALEALSSRPFELVLTDVSMEGMSGLELVRHMGSDHPDVLAVVMTGYASKDIAIQALRAGAHDLLEKPLTPDLVQKAVDRAWSFLRTGLENRRLIAELRESNRRLDESRAAAEASSRQKGALLSRISHGFRTPLNGIVGGHNLLRSADLGEAERRYLDVAERAAAELLALLEQVEQE